MRPEEDDIEVETETDTDMRAGGSVHHGDAEHKVNKLKGEIEHIKKERQEYLDGWQRSKADYVNLLKRSEQGSKEAQMRGKVQAVETLLPAFDALERAKEHLSRSGEAKAGGEGVEGFLGIAKQLEGAFASLGLEPIGEVGERFDPALHEALGQDAVKSEEADDTITAVLEKGWKIGENVIRPAKVRVAHFG